MQYQALDERGPRELNVEETRGHEMVVTSVSGTGKLTEV